MRRACFLAVWTGLTLATGSGLAQQAEFPPVQVPGGYAVPGSVRVPPAVPQEPVSDVVACNWIQDTGASGVAYEESCGDCCRGRLFVAMEYMYWQASRDATPYAGTLTRPSGTAGGLPINSSSSLVSQLSDTSYSRTGGFRANIGYMMCDRWDIGFRYTYFYTHGASSLGDPTVDTNSVLANRYDRNLANLILDTSFDDGEVDFASQRLRLDFDTYDIELRRQLCFDSQRLAARVMGGIRFAEIDQVSQISYYSLEGGNLLSADTDETMAMHGAGILAGGEAHYLMGWGTSCFARGAVSLLYANFDVTRTDLQTSATSAGIRSLSDTYQNIVPVVELNVGIRWQRGRFFAAGGYDFANWFNMVQGMDAINQDDVDGTTNSYRLENGSLSFDGLFAEAGMMF